MFQPYDLFMERKIKYLLLFFIKKIKRVGGIGDQIPPPTFPHWCSYANISMVEMNSHYFGENLCFNVHFPGH